MLEAYIRLSDELEENRMEIYNNKEDVTDESLYSDEEWEVFSNRSKIHFDKLKLEGAFHTSLLPKIKDITNPMLLIVGKHDVVTCENKLKRLIKKLETVSISHLKRAVIHLIMRKQIDSQTQSYIFEMKNRVLL